MFLSCIVFDFLFLSLTLAHPRGNVQNHRHAPRQYTITDTALNWGYFQEPTSSTWETLAPSTSTTSSVDAYSTSSTSLTSVYSDSALSSSTGYPSSMITSQTTSMTLETSSSSTFYSSSTVTSQTTSATSQTSSSSSPIASNSPNSTTGDFLRGVNIGGWLILEEWMSPDVFSGNFQNAVDQWTFDCIDGANDALKNHWDTWFTEDDVQEIKSWGINA